MNYLSIFNAIVLFLILTHQAIAKDFLNLDDPSILEMVEDWKTIQIWDTSFPNPGENEADKVPAITQSMGFSDSIKDNYKRSAVYSSIQGRQIKKKHVKTKIKPNKPRWSRSNGLG